LRQLCKGFLDQKEHVIAIAPTIYDRFHFRARKHFRFLGARQGRNIAVKVVRDALIRTWSENTLVLKNLTRALDYTKFEPCVGIGLFNVSLDFFPDAAARLPRDEAEALHAALLKWQKRGLGNRVMQLSLKSHSWSEIDNLSFAVLAKHERLLRQTHVARMEYFFYRDSRPIPLLEACSGELCFITTVAFISTEIQRNSVILIDEPDTSLHPTWQQSYVRTLLDLFHHYQPRIAISTHSPIIISGAEAASDEVFVYEIKGENALPFDHTTLSLEEMYDRLFGLITPKNHYLSQRAVALLNSLNSGDQNLDQVLLGLGALRTKSYDEKQQAVITKFEDMARRLELMREGRRA